MLTKTLRNYTSIGIVGIHASLSGRLSITVSLSFNPSVGIVGIRANIQSLNFSGKVFQSLSRDRGDSWVMRYVPATNTSDSFNPSVGIVGIHAPKVSSPVTMEEMVSI